MLNARTEARRITNHWYSGDSLLNLNKKHATVKPYIVLQITNLVTQNAKPLLFKMVTEAKKTN